MRIERVFLALAVCGLVVLNACTRPLEGGGGASAGSSAPVTLAITSPFTLGSSNNQPSGVTVISFKITLTGAVLQPGNVSLISGSQTIELTQLQTDNYLIGTKTVATGNYTSLNLTFANPDMTIFNGAGSVSSCTVNTICEFQPTLTVSSVSLSPSLTLTANSPAALQLELSVNDSLQPDLSFNLGSGLTFQQPSSVSNDTTFVSLNTVAGQITAIGSNQFTLLTTNGQSLTVATTSSTQYGYPSTVCSTSNFACLATSQIVSADMIVLGNGSIQAGSVIFEDNSGDPAILGTVAAINTAVNPPRIALIVHGQVPATTGIATNNLATVSLQNPTVYLADADDLTIPSGFTFASTADLVVGQEVLVRGDSIQATAVNNAPDTIAISTGQLILRQSQWTATVGLSNAGSGKFTVTSLPSLFTSLTLNPFNNLLVVTSAQTSFVNISATTLTTGTPATLKGLIFSNTNNTVSSPSDVSSIVQGAPRFPPLTVGRQSLSGLP
jgi:hypothetical protein